MVSGNIIRACALAAALAAMACGCSSERVVFDAAHPEIAVTEAQTVLYRGRPVAPGEVPGLLRASGLSRRDTVYIGIPAGLRDYRTAHGLMRLIAAEGFTRQMLVAPRRSTSEVSHGRKGRGARPH